MATALDTARRAAHAAGEKLRKNVGTDMGVDEVHQYDIKLALDVECQDLISEIILADFPDHAIFGEEGLAGDQSSEHQWIVDPIDGTVNFFYGIPHFCVSIALRTAGAPPHLGVIYDPMADETFVVDGGKATLNGRPMRASSRDKLSDSMVTVGFSKSKESLEIGMERYGRIAGEVRKTRMMGSAALAMAYIAAGRLDAYIEEQISLWDIAAGWPMVEAAGGTVQLTPRPDEDEKYTIVSNNGLIHDALAPLI